MKTGEIALPILGEKSSQCPEYDNNFALLADLMNVCSKINSRSDDTPCKGCDKFKQCQRLIDSRVSEVSSKRTLTAVELWRAVLHFTALWRSEFSTEVRIMDYLRKCNRPVSRRELLRKFTLPVEDVSRITISLNTMGIIDIKRELTNDGGYAIFYVAKYKI